MVSQEHPPTASPPLAGKRVLITRPPAQAPDLAALLEAEGARVITLSSISIEPLEDASALDAALQALARYHWAIFTSVNGVHAVGERLAHLGLSWGVFKGIRVAAIGPATAEVLRVAGVVPDLVPGEYVAEAIAQGIGEVQGQRVLLARADIAREALATELRRKGAEVDEIAAYRTVVRPPDPEALARALAERPDVITFTSSSTVRGFVASLVSISSERIVGKRLSHPSSPGRVYQRRSKKSTDFASEQANPAEALRGVVVACIGPITAQTAREAGLAPQIVAETYTMPGLVQAITAFFAGATHA
ncbi:MAG TPA: uroporphyrinogen-III synthase [Ktedonobacterales bacterium]|jgi:uroporphyrinogen III methyltransferase/synthase